MAQLMPLPLTVSCFTKIQIGFSFLVPADPGSPGQSAVKRVYVCVCVYVYGSYRLDGLGPNAYEAFQASRDLRAVVNKVLNVKTGGSTKGEVPKSISVSAQLMTPIQPMLVCLVCRFPLLCDFSAIKNFTLVIFIYIGLK